MNTVREFVVRIAEARDLENVLDLERQTEYAPHWAPKVWSGILDGTGVGTRRCLYVAVSKAPPEPNGSPSSVLGFAVGAVVHRPMEACLPAELESIGVAQHARRQGVGRELCKAIIEWARGEGAPEVELEVRAANPAALGFYLALGFTETGRRKGYYREPDDDAVLMELAF